MSRVTTYILRAVLEDDPTVSRDIEIDSEKSLSDLAKGIVEALALSSTMPLASTRRRPGAVASDLSPNAS
jgi:hypothetical protein